MDKFMMDVEVQLQGLKILPLKFKFNTTWIKSANLLHLYAKFKEKHTFENFNGIEDGGYQSSPPSTSSTIQRKVTTSRHHLVLYFSAGPKCGDSFWSRVPWDERKIMRDAISQKY